MDGNTIGIPNENSYGDKTVRVVCPICNEKGEIYIPINAVKKSKGLMCVTIAPKIVCEHVFQIYLDKNFKARGYSKSDYDVGFLKVNDEDNFQEIKNNTIVKFVEEIPKDTIPSEFWPVISKINGSRSVGEIIESLSEDKKYVFKVLIELRSLNLISFEFVFDDYDIPKLTEKGHNFLIKAENFFDSSLHMDQSFIDEKRFELVKHIDSKNTVLNIAEKCSIDIYILKRILSFLQGSGNIEIFSDRLKLGLIYEAFYGDFAKATEGYLGKKGIQIFVDILKNEKNPLIKLIKISNDNKFSFEAVILSIEKQKELKAEEIALILITPIINTFKKVKPALSMLSTNLIDEYKNRIFELLQNLAEVFGPEETYKLKKYFI